MLLSRDLPSSYPQPPNLCTEAMIDLLFKEPFQFLILLLNYTMIFSAFYILSILNTKNMLNIFIPTSQWISNYHVATSRLLLGTCSALCGGNRKQTDLMVGAEMPATRKMRRMVSGWPLSITKMCFRKNVFSSTNCKSNRWNKYRHAL